MNNKQFSTGSFIGGLILGVVICSVWFSLGTNIVTSISSNKSSDSNGDSHTQLNSVLSVSNQLAGEVVIVESVNVPAPGVWVAVREMQGSTLGNVLGAARVGEPRTNVEVPLLRDTENGKEYAVELYRDDGSGVFDQSALSVYVDFETTQPVIAYFRTTP